MATTTYPGTLGQRITRPTPEQVGTGDFEDQYIQAVTATKLVELANFYGLNEEVRRGDWRPLVIALARAHITGFKLAKAAPGRKLKWSRLDKAKLRLLTDDLVATHGLTVDAALQRVAKSSPKWIAKVGKAKVTALRQHFYSDGPGDPELRELIVAQVAKARAMPGNQNVPLAPFLDPTEGLTLGWPDSRG